VKFAGELKFPDIDHPGVPVQFVIEGTQAELIVEGESLGRWSLYDVRARRLIASAFEIDLDGTEVTFVAADPIDFAYRGVEHMAQTWAEMKSRRIATRTIAVRKSRRGAMPSRIEELRSAMETNLEPSGPRPIAGEPAMPAFEASASEAEQLSPTEGAAASGASDWDSRDQDAAIPLVGGASSEPIAAEEPVITPAGPEPVGSEKSEAELALEAEKRALAEERARLEEERQATQQREANLIEAYRLEVQRLEAEREELRRLATEAAERNAAAEQAAREAAERATAAEEKAAAESEAAARAQMERETAELEERERQAREREAEVQAELERRIAEREAAERIAAEEKAAREAAEREAAERIAAEEKAARETAEREAAELEERERQARERAAADRDRAEREAPEDEPAEVAAEEEAAPEEEAGPEEERRVAAFDAGAFRKQVVDLDDLEDDGGAQAPGEPSPSPAPKPEPALAGAPKEKGGGLMGAVKAAFKSGSRDHEHQFVEAPGGIGITRYVCEECGYVSISV
jgi:hypothetical protein